MSGGRTYLGQMALNFASGTGRYMWTITAQIDDQEGLCERGSQFTLIDAPEVTAEITSEIPTQTPYIIIVTATPEASETHESTPETTP